MYGAIDFDAVLRRAEAAETGAVRELRLVAEIRATAGLTADVEPAGGEILIAGETPEREATDAAVEAAVRAAEADR